jgi:hypothetical protein
LVGASKALDILAPIPLMLCTSTRHPFSPHFKRGRLHFSAHDFSHFILPDSKLLGNGFEGRTVFPRHLNDAVNFLGRKAGRVGHGFWLKKQNKNEVF